MRNFSHENERRHSIARHLGWTRWRDRACDGSAASHFAPHRISSGQRIDFGLRGHRHIRIFGAPLYYSNAFASLQTPWHMARTGDRTCNLRIHVLAINVGSRSDDERPGQ